MPALGFEIGQFRHGPLELLSPELGVVLLCGDDADRAAVARPGAHGGDRCRRERRHFRLQRRRAARRRDHRRLSAAPGSRAPCSPCLPSLQRLIIAIAARKVDRVGEPIRSTKITREAS